MRALPDSDTMKPDPAGKLCSHPWYSVDEKNKDLLTVMHTHTAKSHQECAYPHNNFPSQTLSEEKPLLRCDKLSPLQEGRVIELIVQEQYKPG